jgi:2-polyprenyl-3-methyl-5-hydroxy-6-metoxy-1,4-benzoquinol methylase
MGHNRVRLRRRGADRGWRWGYQTGAKTREQAVDSGYQQVARLATDIEAHTGVSLASRRALDYGCGWGRLAVPLAERCEYVYGVDIAPSVLSEAAENAKRTKVDNVEWVEAPRLAELSGRYDLILSVLVFQHIPAREGERILATLVQGLRPGGVGAINVTLPPSHLQAGSRGWRGWASKIVALAGNLNRSYVRTLRNSHSLNRLGRLFADAGVTEWHVSFTPGKTPQAHDAVTIIFQKN